MVVLHRNLEIIACMQLLIASTLYLHVEGKVGFGGSEQEWGYVTVRPGAHMFWWLYYTTSKEVTNVYEKPLLIWLSCDMKDSSSSGYGNFKVVGPLDSDLQPRNFSWVKNYNVLFIDAPVGAGFSYVDEKFAFAETDAQSAADLLECIRGFLNKNPKFGTVPTYIIAESYAGKMATEFTLTWIKDQHTGNIKSNLKGIALGNSWISPIDSVLSWGTLLLYNGQIDTDEFNRIEEGAAATKQAVENEKWSTATNHMINTVMAILEPTRVIDFYNILNKVKHDIHLNLNYSSIHKLMNREVKTTLGLNVTWEHKFHRVPQRLSGDIMKPVTHTVERLLNETNIEVFVIAGQLDLLIPMRGTHIWVENLKWTNANEWRAAPRKLLLVNDVIEGYVKQYRNLKMFWINRAGHTVAKDNPGAMEAMLKRLTERTYLLRD